MDLVKLASELSMLKKKMLEEAKEDEHVSAVTAVINAEKAANANDYSKVSEHLKSAGKWAMDIAAKIGVPLAVEALKQSIGV